VEKQVVSKKEVVVQYLFHCGFAVESGNYLLIFDYFDSYARIRNKSDEIKLNSYFLYEELSNKIQSVKYPFVFVSHNHYDHFSPIVFEWIKLNPNLTYILSNDIQLIEKDKFKWSEIDCIKMSPYQSTRKDGLDITTFGSTDIGVSFYVGLNGLKLFHAGDLNWWHWADESTEDELEEEEKKFKEEVARIEGNPIDIMFFPVDPRLGDYYWLGGTYMIEVFKPGLFVPMHFAENTDIIRKFVDRMKKHKVPIFAINQIGQYYNYITK
jgi:L-ascorbate metabolism protein UlaG (beta-lactamase superfamily)